MKVLVVHNRYQSSMPSGENVVVDTEIGWLRERGVDVATYIRSSDEVTTGGPATKIDLALRYLWSSRARREAREAICGARPDVVHVHNVYPLISPLLITVAHQEGIPVIQTVHNYRHVCANGTHFRDGHNCLECVGHRIPWPAALHACYRSSPVQSAIMATSLTVHRRTFLAVDRFIALTPQIAGGLRRFGVPDDRISIKPNSVPDPGPPGAPGSGFLFAGRLSEEKGVDLLLSAWRRLPDHSIGTLTVAGDGPLRHMVEDICAIRSDVRYVGWANRDEVKRLMAEAAVVVIPSGCPDVFPQVALEAMASGRALLATAVGGLPDIVTDDTGWIVSPNVEALGEAMAAAALSDLRKIGEQSRLRYERHYHPRKVITRLVEIYEDVRRAHPITDERYGSNP